MAVARSQERSRWLLFLVATLAWVASADFKSELGYDLDKAMARLDELGGPPQLLVNFLHYDDADIFKRVLARLLNEGRMDSRALSMFYKDLFHINDYSFIHFAAARLEDNPGHVQFLLDAGVDKELQLPNGARPLHVAAGKGNERCMKVLLAAGANPFALTGNSQMTAATIATRDGKMKTLRVFKDFGGDALLSLTKRDGVERPGYTMLWAPLHYAVHNGNVEVMRFLLYEVDKVLLAKEAPLEELITVARKKNHTMLVPELQDAFGVKRPEPEVKRQAPSPMQAALQALQVDLKHIFNFRKNAVVFIVTCGFLVGVFIACCVFPRRVVTPAGKKDR